MKYTVQGWKRGTICVKSRNVARPATVIREAQHQVLDLGADTVWVWVEGRTAYTMNEALRWQKHAGEPALEAAVAAIGD